MSSFVPPADAIHNAIATGNRRTSVPLFTINSRWLHPKPEPLAAARPREPDTRVWHDRSGFTTAGYACEFFGQPEAAVEAARNGWVTRRANAANGRNGNG